MKKSPGNLKVGIIGAGNVGAMLAHRIVERDLADVVLVDVDEGISMAKAYDMQDASPIMGYEKEITGTSDYSHISGCQVVVVTAGFPRKPGMMREDLIKVNGAIICDVSLKIRQYAPESIVIIVTNPLDVMAYLAYKATGFPAASVIGMAGVLDSARCSLQISEMLGVANTEVDSIVIGSHDNNMVPLLSHTKAQGKIVAELLDKERRDKVIELTQKRGTQIVSLLKSGSAFFAPSASCFIMIKSILNDERLTMCVSAYLEGEYGLKDIYIGVPAIIGKKGVEKIIELELTDEERAAFVAAALMLRAADKAALELIGK